MYSGVFGYCENISHNLSEERRGELRKPTFLIVKLNPDLTYVNIFLSEIQMHNQGDYMLPNDSPK